METLRFGLKRAVPEDARAAWGARLIFPDDVVWDRTDCVGEPEEKRELLSWLENYAREKPWATARELAAASKLRAGGSEQVTLFEDDQGIVVGSALASFGYLYAVAYLKRCEHCGVRLGIGELHRIQCPVVLEEARSDG